MNKDLKIAKKTVQVEINALKKLFSSFSRSSQFSKAVSLNAAAGLIVSERYSKFSDAYQNARKQILSGKTYEHLKNIQND